MEYNESLYQLEKHHKITLTTEEIDGAIYTTVHCPYWVRKKVTFTMSHSAKDYSHYEAKTYFIPRVMEMAGLVYKTIITTSV